jgi:RNA polymerase primary sigma factor
MIRGLCESALTFEAIMVWRDELRQGRILLREIIDLDGTYGAQNPRPTRPRRRRRSPRRLQRGDEDGDAVAAAEASEEDDFDDGAGPTVSAMEAELREGVMATLDAVADCFESFRRLQEKLVERRLRGEDLPKEDRARYDELNTTIVRHLKTLKLNNNRIEALVEQLYAINKKLMGLEGRLLRLADSYGISRASSCAPTSAASWTPAGARACATTASAGPSSPTTSRARSTTSAATSRCWRPSRACRSTTSAASSTVQKGEREARQAKKEMVEANLRLVISSPRSTPTAACSSWT